MAVTFLQFLDLVKKKIEHAKEKGECVCVEQPYYMDSEQTEIINKTLDTLCSDHNLHHHRLYREYGMFLIYIFPKGLLTIVEYHKRGNELYELTVKHTPTGTLLRGRGNDIHVAMSSCWNVCIDFQRNMSVLSSFI
jgi:hypothetical protein